MSRDAQECIRMRTKSKKSTCLSIIKNHWKRAMRLFFVGFIPLVVSFGIDRRLLLKNAGTAAAAASVGGSLLTPNKCYAVDDLICQAYQVCPDASARLDPTLKAIKPNELIKRLSRTTGALWLGEHHNSVRDHTLQTEIICQLHSHRPKNRPMAIGLEQVQIKFQPALDDYIAGTISLEKMKQLVEWETRWQWPFEGYQPIFEAAREQQIPLKALNVNSEDLILVENGGLPSLSQEQLRQYISDPRGFAEFAKPLSYRTYVDYVIRPSYDLHKAMGLLDYSLSGKKLEQPMSFRNFFSGRILWDESMANQAYDWTSKNQNGLLVGLVGADHVKFGLGIPARFARFGTGDLSSTSVMLNPSLIDTSPPGSVGMTLNNAVSTDSITLQLRYVKDGVNLADPKERYQSTSTGGVLSLADYLLVN